MQVNNEKKTHLLTSVWVNNVYLHYGDWVMVSDPKVKSFGVPYQIEGKVIMKYGKTYVDGVVNDNVVRAKNKRAIRLLRLYNNIKILASVEDREANSKQIIWKISKEIEKKQNLKQTP
jgi:hypothetical protein